MQRQLSTPAMPRFAGEEEVEEDHGGDLEARPEKKAAAASATERYVHLVPLLTVLCFLVLFLCSRDPSASDVSTFGGKVASKKPKLL